MKRTLSVVALVMVGLTACGSNDDEDAAGGVSDATPQSASSETAEAPTTIGSPESTADRTDASATTEPAPTTTVALTSAPGGDVGTRGNPVPLGQPAEVGGGWTAVVNSVNLNANDQVAAANQFNEPPADGSVFVLANVTVTYNGIEPSDTGGVNFEALGAATNTAINVGSGTLAVAPEPLQAFTEVFQGGSLTGNVLLEVPVADIDTFVLIGHALLSFDDDDRAFFAVR